MPPVADMASLYACAPGAFVAARDELVKALRAAGERQRAAEVAMLRRPTVAAWALDQVARQAPELITQLLTAGAALRDATRTAMGGDASALRAAEGGERSAVAGVVARAEAESKAMGVALNDSHRQRIAATLRAAVLDAEVAHALRAGTLDADHEAAPLGFDPGASVAPKPHRPAPPVTTAEARAHRAGLDRLRKEADRLARRADRLRVEADEATARAAELRAQAKDAAAAARAADREVTAAARRAPRQAARRDPRP